MLFSAIPLLIFFCPHKRVCRCRLTRLFADPRIGGTDADTTQRRLHVRQIEAVLQHEYTDTAIGVNF